MALPMDKETENSSVPCENAVRSRPTGSQSKTIMARIARRTKSWSNLCDIAEHSWLHRSVRSRSVSEAYQTHTRCSNTAWPAERCPPPQFNHVDYVTCTAETMLGTSVQKYRSETGALQPNSRTIPWSTFQTYQSPVVSDMKRRPWCWSNSMRFYICTIATNRRQTVKPTASGRETCEPSLNGSREILANSLPDA